MGLGLSTTASQILDVNGNISLRDISGGGHFIFNETNGVIDWGSGTSGDLYFRKLTTQGSIGSYTDLMIIKNDGSVGIGNTSPQYKLDVTGSLRTNSNLEIGSAASNPAIPLTIDQSSGQYDGIKFTGNSIGRTAYEVVAVSSSSFSRFKTFVDGRTYIGQFPSPAYDGTASMLTVGQPNVNYKVFNLVSNTVPSAPTDLLNVYGSGKTEIIATLANANDAALGIRTSQTGANNFHVFGNGALNIGTSSLVPPNSLMPLSIFQNSAQYDGIKFYAASSGRNIFELTRENTTTTSWFKIFGDGKTYIGTFASPQYDPLGSILTVGQGNGTLKALNIVNNTNTSAPIDMFTVYGSGKTELKMNSANATDDALVIMDANNANAQNLRIKKNGNVYTGDHVEIGKPSSSNVSATGNIALGVFQDDATSSIAHCTELRNNVLGAINTLLVVDRDDQVAIELDKWTSSGYSRGLKVMGNGAMYIGPKLPIGNHANAMLSVYGKVLATSVYVNTDPAVWSDYVFNEDYKLPALYEVEKYYKQHKHLPDVPSAEEIGKNGNNLGETDAVLLKKIEELTLYVVELRKEIDTLKAKK